jgi:phosphatidylserine/phosphatidylglycerophosphate/cardiolipin synthase-like enzyme
MAMSIALTFLEQERQKPADIAGLLAEFIAAARESLDIAIYDFRLSDELAVPVVAALRDRAAAGVQIRIAYDAGKRNVSFRQVSADPSTPGTATFIEKIGKGIQAKAITGGDPHMPRLMHQKYLIRDAKTPAAALWTGSTNFTDDSWQYQENNIVRVDSPALCTYYQTDLTELWSRGDIATTGTHDTGSVQVNGNVVTVFFAPGDGRLIDHEIAHCLAVARRRVRMCSMLINSGAILGALCDMLKHGEVRDYSGVYDGTQMASVLQQWRGTPSEWKIGAFQQVSQGLAGKRSTPYSPNSRHDYMHNKVAVADDTVITGSYNFSHSATENAENVLMIRNPELADRYSAYIDGLVKRYL